MKLFDDNFSKKNMKIIINNDINNPVFIKKIYNKSVSCNNLLLDNINLPTEKLSSSYCYIDKSDILDISEVNSNEVIVNKKLLFVKNRSFSSDSLLNFNIDNKNICRILYNYYLSFHNIVHK
jgi:hypothetical protein